MNNPLSPPPDRQTERDSGKVLKVIRERVQLFKDGDTGYGLIRQDGATKVYKLDSQLFSRWLKTEAVDIIGRGLNQSQASDIIDTLQGFTDRSGVPCEVSLRFAKREGVVYLDLCNPAWEAVKITDAGWEVIRPDTPLFTRTDGMLPLPIPTTSTDLTPMWGFFNLPREADRLLVWVWLLTALMGDSVKNTMLVFNGEQGSAKSTACQLLKVFLDPTKGSLRSKPREERDLFIAAQGSSILVFDNLSGLNDTMSDALCRLVTRGDFACRQLYADAGEIILKGRGNVILNGINEIVTRQDLLERAVVLNLPTISAQTRQSDEDFQAAFEAHKPAFLGALLHDLSGVLRHLPHVPTTSLPRMTHYAQVGMALMLHLGRPPEDFLAIYQKNTLLAVEESLDGEPVAEALVLLMERMGPVYKAPKGHFYAELGTCKPDLLEFSQWPRSPQHLTTTLRRLQPALRRKGFTIGEERTNKTRFITIQYKEPVL